MRQALLLTVACMLRTKVRSFSFGQQPRLSAFLKHPNAAATTSTRSPSPSTSTSTARATRRQSSSFHMTSLKPPRMSASDEADGLYLFDFDGVVCDSCDECTVSAFRTCQKLGVLDDVSDAVDIDSDGTTLPDWLFQKMREIRPAIETGWQIPVLLYVFLEQQQQQQHKEPTMSPAQIVANYETLIEETLTKWGKSDEDMIQTFGDVRDSWIREDLGSWLDINAFYDGIPAALSSCKGRSALITTKQQRFAIALCRHAGIDEETLPDGNIYGLGQYKSKADVIVDQMQAGSFRADETHFFEDRWPTLEKCLKDDRLEGVKLHLCNWGYCTEDEVEKAQSEPRVAVLDLRGFVGLVQKD